MRSGSGVGRASMGVMSKEERFHMAVRAPGSGGGISRLYGPGSSQRRRLRSASALKKPPEPLRRAVADCLSSSAPHVHGTPPALLSEAGRTLRDYLAAPTTTDMAYGVLLEHTLAERERSPAVVSRCVDLLKRYLIRYVPKLQTLRQIDEFCANSIAECNYVCNRGNSLGHRTGETSASGSTVRPSLVASNYASASLVKSLNYVRSLVVRHIPKLSFQPVALNPATNTLSSLLSRSMSSDLSPKIVSSQVASEAEVVSSPFALDPSRVENAGVGNDKYISDDLLKWRWHGDKEDLLSARNESATVMRPQDVQEHCFLEVGAAALFVGDLESKTQDQIWRHSSADLPGSDQLLHPSAVTTANSFPFADNHLKAITASKRVKPGPHQVWMNIPVSTFHPRARTLFQYRYYSEQQPLRLNPAEVSDVIAAVCFECSPNPNPMLTSLKFSNPGGKPSTEVAVSVLVKLVIDMYMMDPGMAAALTLFMLEDMLSSSKLSSRVRVFDVIANLGVHAHLLEPMFTENPSMVEEKTSQDVYLTHEGPNNSAESSNQKTVASAIENFESWLLVILYEILPLLVQKEEREEIVWASALSCLLYFICDRGEIWRNRLEGLDIRVVKAFLDISRENSWSEIVHRKLVSILVNMFYRVSEPSNTHVDPKEFLAEQVDLLGGIYFVCLEYARANMREEKQDLFVVLLDYAVYQINEVSLASGGSKHSSNDIQPVATMLMLADAPEAFYVAVKHGVDGVGDILKRSVSFSLSRSSNVEHLSLLLEEITGKLDATISSFTRLDDEFSSMLQVTNSSKYMNSVEDLESENSSKIKLSWTTLHSLLYSERSAYRHNGYIWLVELLISGITEEGDLCSNIKNLQQQIVLACSQDYCFSVPIPVSIFCGLLKSKYSYVRWGFLFVLEKLLMHCKLLLDENNMQYSNEEAIESEKEECRLEKANTVVDIMSCGLALLVQINETDRINILKMCDMLFSQLSLRLLPASKMPHSDFRGNENILGYAKKGSRAAELHVFKHKIGRSEGRSEDCFLGGPSDMRDRHPYPHVHESASMAALLLRGCATVPMQLVARVPIPVLYWPLIQLAGAATDDISLGVAVGSRGRGNLPGASSDIRAALLLLLNCKCTTDPNAFFEVGGKDFFRELLDDTDSRVAYYSSAFLLKRMMTDEPEKYQRLLQNLIFKAQQSNNEKLLENPYLQMRGILHLLNDMGADL